MIKQPTVDLTEWASPVEDQWNLGSCTGQAIVGAYELLIKKDYPDQFVDLSRLFVYYNARRIEGYVNEDVGAYIKNGIRAVADYGICAESLWPYNIDMFDDQPSDICYQDAKNRTLSDYHKVDTIDELIDTLALAHPVVIGIQVFDGFSNLAQTDPIVKMPRDAQEPIGGHAMCVTGYDMNKRLFKVRNSFGNDWADNGYGYFTFDYASEYFTDMWAFDIKLNGINNNT